MITTKDLDSLLALMHQHGLDQLRLREGSTFLALTLEKNGSPSAEGGEAIVQARGLGRFRPFHPRQSQPMVSSGDLVAADTIIAFLENGDVLLPVVAGHRGKFVRFSVEDGSLIGFGTPVARLSTES